MNPEVATQIPLSPAGRTEIESSITALKSSGAGVFLHHLQEYGILAVFILEFVFFSLTSTHVLTPENLINVTLQTSI